MKDVLQTVLSAAVRTGSKLVKDTLMATTGPIVGGMSGVLIDSIAGRLGVPPQDIPSVPVSSLERAVTQVNDDPEIMRLYIEQQRLANDLMQAEMKQGEAAWTWVWRPAWMWFLMALWAWNGVLVHVLNSAFRTDITTLSVEALGAITATYTAFYMGGHTVKKTWGRD